MEEQVERNRSLLFQQSPLLPLPNSTIPNPLRTTSRDHSPPVKEDARNNNSNSNATEDIHNNTNRTKSLSSLLASLLQDQRRTNNNRIGKSIWKLALINYLLFLSLCSSFEFAKAEPFPKPVRISSPYAKAPTVRYSDTDNYYNNRNSSAVTITSARTYNSSNPDSNNNNKNHNDNNNNNNNANRTISSKNFSTSQVTSIARPFYTKITSEDAVAKPTHFVHSFTVPLTSTKKPKRSKKPKVAFQIPASSTTERFINVNKDDNNSNNNNTSFVNYNNNNFMSSSTSSSTSFLTSDSSGPKIRLEPFFNLLTNFQSLALGTSKEQKFSPSYQTITQSISENTKKSRGKGTKGMREKKRNRKKQHKGPIPIPIPKPLIDPEDMAADSKKTIVHPLDVLRISVPTGSSSLESEQLPTAESLKSLESITKPNHWPYKIDTTQRSVDRNNPIGSFNFTGREGPESRERRLRSDFFQNFHDKDVELQADESVIHDDVMEEASEDQMHPPPSSSNGGRNVNIPQGYTHQGSVQDADEPGTAYHVSGSYATGGPSQGQSQSQPPYYSTIYTGPNSNKEDIEMISKYPVSFSYNPVNHNKQQNNNRLPFNGPPQPYPGPYPTSKNRRPNFPGHYHNYGQPNGHHYSSGYGNIPPGFSNQGSHYVGHTMTNPPPPPPDHHQVQHIPYGNPPTSASEVQPGASSVAQETELDTSQTFETDNSVSNSNQKIGVMSSFEVFYKDYKLLTWAGFLVLTSLALLSLLVYLYVNNPPTEVVQARDFSLQNLIGNPQILKFLSGLVENNTPGRHKRKRYKAETMSKASNSLGGKILTAIKKDL